MNYDRNPDDAVFFGAATTVAQRVLEDPDGEFTRDELITLAVQAITVTDHKDTIDKAWAQAGVYRDQLDAAKKELERLQDVRGVVRLLAQVADNLR